MTILSLSCNRGLCINVIFDMTVLCYCKKFDQQFLPTTKISYCNFISSAGLSQNLAINLVSHWRFSPKNTFSTVFRLSWKLVMKLDKPAIIVKKIWLVGLVTRVKYSLCVCPSVCLPVFVCRSSEEWQKIVKSDREKIGLTFDNDGEFWSVPWSRCFSAPSLQKRKQTVVVNQTWTFDGVMQ